MSGKQYQVVRELLCLSPTRLAQERRGVVRYIELDLGSHVSVSTARAHNKPEGEVGPRGGPSGGPWILFLIQKHLSSNTLKMCVLPASFIHL